MNRDIGSPNLEGESRKAEARALKLLLYKMRTVRELRERLAEEGYSEEDVETALAYCKSFGYLNDEKYAENYILSMKDRKSRSAICRELEDKGVAQEYIEEALSEVPYDEDEVVAALMRRKAGEPHKFDEKELRRTYAFLARKGFSSAQIWKAVHDYQNEDGNME